MTEAILRKRFPEKEYALMAEVRNAAGMDAGRSADFIAVNLWPSRGLCIHGIEVKSHRSDWLNELKQPEKSQAIFQYCDFFWLFTSDESVAKLEEIPMSWGWMTLKNDRIKTMKEAPKQEPKPVTRSFMCAMLKRASSKEGYVLRAEISDKLERAYSDGKDYSKQDIDRKNAELQDLHKSISDFEQAMGVHLDFRFSSRFAQYNDGKIAKAIKFLVDNQDGGLTDNIIRLENLEKSAGKIHADIVSGIQVLKELSLQE